MANEEAEIIEAPKKKSRTMLMVVMVVLVLGVGGGAFFLLHRARPAAKAPEDIPQIKAVLHLEPFVLNTADPDARSYLRIGIDLGLDRVAKPGEKESGPAPTALVRDTILTILSGARTEDIATAEGKVRLKEQIARALQARAPELGVREVYFTEFLVQN